MSENKSDIVAVLLRAKAAFPVIKRTGYNKHFNSYYATLDDIVDGVTPALAAEGLNLSYPTQWYGEAGCWVVMATVELASTGEVKDNPYPVIAADWNNPQSVAGGTTYAARKALSGLLGISTEPDDDGNAATTQGASQRPAQAPRQAPASAPAPNTKQLAPGAKTYPATEKQINFVELLMRQKLALEGRDHIHVWLSDFLKRTVLSVKSLTNKDASAVIAHLTGLPDTAEVAAAVGDEPPPYDDKDLPF